MIAYVLISTGCKNDDNNPVPVHSYRLTEVAWEESGVVESRYVFSYDGDKTTHWEGFDQDSLKLKADVTYPSSSTIEISTSELDVNTWYTTEKMVYTINNNNKVELYEEYDYEDSVYTLTNSTAIKYNSNGDIVERDFSFFDNNVEYITERKKYSYDGTKLTEVVNDNKINDVWVSQRKLSYQYDGAKLISSVKSVNTGDAWETVVKNIFNYNGDLVSNVKTYVFHNSTLGDLTDTEEYVYDANNNISKVIETPIDGDPFMSNYKYEKNSGNLSLFGNYDQEYGYPNPVYSHKNKAMDVIFSDFK